MSAPLRTAAAAVAALALLAGASGARAADHSVARTPPMGWNSWNTFGCTVSEQDIKRAADAIVATGMKAAGYRLVVVDDCWFDPQRGADGRLRPDPERFPGGIKALADYVHARGLKFGIYEAPRAKTCGQMSGAIGGATGSLGHVRQDARTFAQWGVDYLKYDYCSPEGSLYDQVATFKKMRDALRATGRRIVYSINPNSLHETTGAAYDWSRVADMWRTTQDLIPLWDREPWYSALQGSIQFDGIVNSVDETAPLAAQAGPGHWNDPDMLVVGTQVLPFLAKTFANVPASTTEALADPAAMPTLEEMRSQVSMWAMVAAPLMAGNDPTNMASETLATLTNRAVIAVDQDRLGVAGTPVRKVSDQEVWSRPLTGGAVAVALFNRGQAAATITVSAQTAGLDPASSYGVRDLWSGAKSTTTGALSAQVPAHGVVLLRVRALG